MSTSESKKASKKEHQEDKNTDEIPVEEVHTVNNWESVDLGDDQRKQKFLRLMGAKKRKEETPTQRQTSHNSNPDEDVIPEKKHCRSQAETETIERELEKQFTEGLQSKIAHKHHGGLGFHDDTPTAASSTDWKHQPTKSAFVPAKTEVGAAMDHVKVNENDDETSDKKEKKKKSKS